MRVAHINASDLRGGAARAAWRIHQAMLKANIDSSMMVYQKESDAWRVWEPSRKGQIYKKVLGCMENAFRQKMGAIPRTLPWSLNFFSSKELLKAINSSKADIVNLHWINNSCLSIKDIGEIEKPLVWTLHDTWPFTGGCHYFGKCVRYKVGCSSCPQAEKSWVDLARFQYRLKARTFGSTKLSIIAPSNWMGNCAKESALFRGLKIHVIPNTLDQDVYRPLDKCYARKIMKIPLNRQVILFGADTGTHDKRKGYDLLCGAVEKLHQRIGENHRVLLIVFGASAPYKSEKFPFDVYYVGRLYDDYTLSLLYNVADIFVAPSREDNLPNTVLEAMSCGTPCVGFSVGGIPDMIISEQNGYLATPFDENELAYGMEISLQHHTEWGINARKMVLAKHDEIGIAQKYTAVYKELL